MNHIIYGLWYGPYRMVHIKIHSPYFKTIYRYCSKYETDICFKTAQNIDTRQDVKDDSLMTLVVCIASEVDSISRKVDMKLGPRFDLIRKLVES